MTWKCELRWLWPLVMLAAGAHGAPPQFVERVLPNGLTVVLAERHTVPLVTVRVTVKCGPDKETPNISGYSHLLEHLLLSNELNRPAEERPSPDREVAGIPFQGRTSAERVDYSGTATSERLAGLLTFLAGRLVSPPPFDAETLKHELPVLLAELDESYSPVDTPLQKATGERLWWRYPTRKLPAGIRDVVARATVGSLQYLEERCYVPDNAMVAVAGDIDPEEAFGLVSRAFARWERREDPLAGYWTVKHPPLPQTSVVVVPGSPSGVRGSLAWHGPSAAGSELPDTLVADLLTYAINAPESRFQRELVGSGACLSVDVAYQTQVNVGPLWVQFQAAPGGEDGCITSVLAQLPRLKDPSYLSDSQLRNAGLAIELKQAVRLETAEGLAVALSYSWAGPGLDYLRGYVDGVRGVSRAALGAFLDRYLLGRPYVLAVQVPGQERPEATVRHFERLIGAQPWREREVDR